MAGNATHACNKFHRQSMEQWNALRENPVIPKPADIFWRPNLDGHEDKLFFYPARIIDASDRSINRASHALPILIDCDEVAGLR